MSSEARPHATLSFDIEGSGSLRAKNQMLSWGWCLQEADGTQNTGQVALYLGKLESETWERFWGRNGWDMDCFNEFWSKNLDKLFPLQISPDLDEAKYDYGALYERYVGVESFLENMNENVNVCTGKDSTIYVIESDSYQDHVSEQKEWFSDGRAKAREKHSPIFYIRAYTERQLVYIIHDVLKDLQSRYQLTYLSDTLHYDASWTDMLLEKYGFPPLLYDQSGDMSFKRMCWGRELGSFQMGMSATNNNRTETKEQYTKTKRWIESRISNGWDPKNSHFAVDDAMQINGSWDEVERENRRRFKLHQRLAHAIREPAEIDGKDGDTGGMIVRSPEFQAEKDDPTPNWVHFYNFIEDNITDLCDMAEKYRVAKRQRTQK